MDMKTIKNFIREAKLMTNDKKIIAPAVSVAGYAVILGLIGIFGKGNQKGIKKLMKYATMLAGLGFAAWLPGRIIEALEKNKVHVEEVEQDNKIIEAANEAKKKKERILKAINKGETL